MKQFELTNVKQNTNDLANLFDIVQDSNGNYIFNMSKTLVIKNIRANSLPPRMYNVYTVKFNDSWTNISYKFYNTIELWWVICKFNNIKDPTNSPIEGESLIIPIKSIAQSIVKLLKDS